jgi:hypothetical protein
VLITGVTPLGLGAGIAGGLFVGIVFFLGGLVSPYAALGGSAAVQAAAAQWPIIPLGTACVADCCMVHGLLVLNSAVSSRFEPANDEHGTVPQGWQPAWWGR